MLGQRHCGSERAGLRRGGALGLTRLRTRAQQDVQFAELLTRHGLLDFIIKVAGAVSTDASLGTEGLLACQQHMVPGFTEDDVILQVVMLVGTIGESAERARVAVLAPTRVCMRSGGPSLSQRAGASAPDCGAGDTPPREAGG
jgi:hypothetical protein